MTVITQDDHAFAYPHSDTLLCSIVTFLGFLILLSVFWFFRESFGFPWATWFYHELFAFADSFFELFGFAVSFLLLPWAIWFCRELFGFALSFLVFPWVIWFFLELFGFSVSYLVSPWAFGFTITVVTVSYTKLVSQETDCLSCWTDCAYSLALLLWRKL